jgi:class 3 adenylate cyclase
LNELYTTFDETLQSQYGVYKFKCINNTYCFVSGYFEHTTQYITQAADAALKLLTQGNEIVNKFKDQTKKGPYHIYPLELSAGMACGPVCGYLQGYSKLSFDLYSQTVRDAELLSQLCKPGNIHFFSKEILEDLKQDYTVTSNEIVEFPLRGKTECWCLIDKKVTVHGSVTPDPLYANRSESPVLQSRLISLNNSSSNSQAHNAFYMTDIQNEYNDVQ